MANKFEESPVIAAILQRLAIVEAAQSGTYPDLTTYVKTPSGSPSASELVLYDSTGKRIEGTGISKDNVLLKEGHVLTEQNFSTALKEKLTNLPNPNDYDLSGYVQKITGYEQTDLGKLLVLGADGVPNYIDLKPDALFLPGEVEASASIFPTTISDVLISQFSGYDCVFLNFYLDAGAGKKVAAMYQYVVEDDELINVGAFENRIELDWSIELSIEGNALNFALQINEAITSNFKFKYKALCI